MNTNPILVLFVFSPLETIPHPPIYLGGFSPKTFARIVKYDVNGWLGVVGGPLEYTENCINTIKDNASKSNKNPDNFRTIMLTYPNVRDDHHPMMIKIDFRYP